MNKKELESLFNLAGIEILSKWELANQYWPRVPEFYDTILASPWWLVKTKAGLVRIGWRKRVIEIDWEDTAIRTKITNDAVTCEETLVHAWTIQDALRYLTALSNHINQPQATQPND